MDYLIKNGDFEIDHDGNITKIYDKEEALQRALIKLTTRKKGFSPDINIGSELYKISGFKPSEIQKTAEKYVYDALAMETDIELEKVTVQPKNGELYLYIDLIFNGEKDVLEVPL